MTVTNALRLVKQAGIEVEVREYEVIPDDFDGSHVAQQLGLESAQVFKTLVTQNAKKERFVFVVPVDGELDLKKAAKASGQKSIEMLPLRELTNVTGYVRGGCSPVGMKKKLPTFIDETAVLFDFISVSAGQRGVQMLLNAEALAAYIGAAFADLT